MNLPKCEYCGKHDDFFYFLDGDRICEKCFIEDIKKYVEEFPKDFAQQFGIRTQEEINPWENRY